MPNPQTSADHIPFRTCIRLENVSQARTSSIDAEWESLSVAKTRESALPMASARPRFETLPGIGPETRPAPALKAQSSGRSPLLMLAATLSLGLALVAVLAGRFEPGIFSLTSPVLSVQAALMPTATSEPSASPMSAPAQTQLPARTSAAEPALSASQSEPPRAKSGHRRKPALRPTPSDPRLAADDPVPSLATANHYRARQTLASTDNPY